MRSLLLLLLFEFFWKGSHRSHSLEAELERGILAQVFVKELHVGETCKGVREFG